jgi:hypothetical protein
MLTSEQTRAELRAPTADAATAVLPAICALAAIASVGASLWIGAGENTARPQRQARKAIHVLRDLETDCLVLQTVFRRLGRNLRGPGGAIEKSAASAAMKFGQPSLDLASADNVEEIGRVLGTAARNAIEVMRCVEEGTIEAPEEIFYAFGECQDKLNRLLAERTGIRTSIDIGLETAMKLTELVKELKRHARG